MGRKTLTYQEYLDSDIWKCVDAPVNPDILLQLVNNTGAHYWVELQPNPNGTFHTGIFICRYCHSCRKFPADWNSHKSI